MARVTRQGRKTEAFWRRLIRGQAGSGVSIRAWCRRHGVYEATFYQWRARLAQRDAEHAPTEFVPVQVVEPESAVSDASLEIVLVGGHRVRVRGSVDRQVLAEVVAVLTGAAEGRAC
jgi:transposase-like protein